MRGIAGLDGRPGVDVSSLTGTNDKSNVARSRVCPAFMEHEAIQAHQETRALQEIRTIARHPAVLEQEDYQAFPVMQTLGAKFAQ